MNSPLTRPGEGPAFLYAGTPLATLAGADGTGPWAAAEIVLPALFRGPIPHVHDTFDEAIYVIEGTLQVVIGRQDRIEAPAGSFLTAARGIRHSFSNPAERPARILGLWSPAREGLDFMRAVGPALPPSGPPDPDTMQALYEAHGSRLQP